MQVLKYEIGVSYIAYAFLEDLIIQLKDVARVGEHVNFEACLDIMDLLYEKEDTSILFSTSKCLAASILAWFLYLSCFKIIGLLLYILCLICH